MTIIDEIGEKYDSFKLISQNRQSHNVQAQNQSLNMLLDVMGYMDFLVVALSAFIAQIAVVQSIGDIQATPVDYKYLFPATICSVITYSILKSAGIYRAYQTDIITLTIGLLASFSIVLLTGLILQVTASYSFIWFAIWFGVALSGVAFLHILRTQFVGYCVTNGMFSKRVAIVGLDTMTVADVHKKLMQYDGNTEIVDIFQIGDAETVSVSEKLIALGQKNKVDQIILAVSSSEKRKISQIIEKLKVLPVEILVCPSAQPQEISVLDYRTVGDFELQLIHDKPINGWSHVQKAALDFILGTIALILFAPAMALIALAIKLDSKGPVFFKQRRHGYNHKIIEVYKFRTMSVMEDGDVIKQAQKDDSRVTWVGKILRKTSLDELPQLFNVLKGEMSLVGPRPHALAHNHEYAELIQKYSNRHRVKPGITGWAQINGFRGPTNAVEDMKKRAELDLYYIDNWSIWLDLRIIILTPLFGFMNRNAF